MDVVALVGLSGSVEDESPKLAADLGITTYEAALLLRLPTPQVLLRTEERARTVDLLAKLRGRGHDALACDLAAVVSSAAMFKPRSFRFEGGAFVGLAGGNEQRVECADFLALVRATHVTTNEETIVDRERKVSIGRAALTGGLLTTKTTAKESKRVSTERETVLYLFSHRSTPWLLVASDLRYDGLSDARAFSTHENFDALCRRLREHAPAAVYDTRLVPARPSTTILSTSSKQTTTTSSSAIDVLAHLVAMAIHRTTRPYR